MEITVDGPKFYSSEDEKWFFTWISKIKAVTRMSGHLRTLTLQVENIDDESLRELLALFYRYNVDMGPLAQFRSDASRSWFYDNKEAYSLDEVFGETEVEYRFVLRFEVRHPSMRPERITEALELEPHRAWAVGVPRRNPRGDPLPGVYIETSWGYLTWHKGRRNFFDTMAELLDSLADKRPFLDELISSGGGVSMIIYLPGDVNIGDELEASVMKRLAELNISVGVEVFPQFGSEDSGVRRFWVLEP
jgi:hypothetical protein